MRYAIVGTGRLGLSFALALCSSGDIVAGHTSRSADGRNRAGAVLETPPSPSISTLVASVLAWTPGSGLDPAPAVDLRSDGGSGIDGSAPADAAALETRALETHSLVVFLLTVPDKELPTVATELAAAFSQHAAENSHSNGSPGRERSAPRWAVIHTSGATPVSVLDPCAEAGAVTLSLHPLQTFSEPVRGASLLRGAAMAVTAGPDPTKAAEALAVGERLASTVGGRPFRLHEEHRALYHAAATMASNYLVGLEYSAERLFELAGMSEGTALTAFLPLVRGAVDNIAAQGTVDALTGPLSRGDRDTVAAHLSALAASAPGLVDLYRVLGTATLEIVRERGELPDPVIESLERTMSVTAERTVERAAERTVKRAAECTPDHEPGDSVERTPDTLAGEITVATRYLTFSTRGEGDVIDLTDRLKRLLRESGLASGTLTMFAPGATGALTTLEFEPGVVHDFKQLFGRIIPADGAYRHNLLLSDGNGHSHVRAGLLGPSLVVPFVEGRLTLGTWQEAVFVCFDNRPRDREVVVQMMGVK